MLFAGWEVRIVKNCDRGLFTIRTDPKPVNNFFFSPSSQTKNNSRKKTHASITGTVVRDRKIRTALKTNQIVGFVTVPAWEKNKTFYSCTKLHFRLLLGQLVISLPQYFADLLITVRLTSLLEI